MTRNHGKLWVIVSLPRVNSSCVKKDFTHAFHHKALQLVIFLAKHLIKCSITPKNNGICELAKRNKVNNREA